MTNIISIDGGGLKGIVSIMALKAIELRNGAPLRNNISLMAGTSTGGIISLGYSLTGNLESILDIYMEYGDEIFPQKSKVGKVFNGVNSFFNPKYSRCGLEEVAYDYFDLSKLKNGTCNTMVTSYDVLNNEVFMFKSRSMPDVKMVDAALATSAAPTYFPPLPYEGRQLVDGGIYINNPTMAAVSEVMKHNQYYGLKEKDLSKLNVLSVGTGRYKSPIPNSGKWGKLEWITRITNTMMEANNDAVVYECENLLPNFTRINFELFDNIQMDDSTKVNELFQYGKKLITSDKFYLQVDKFLTNFA